MANDMLEDNQHKIKCAAMTTIDANLSWFVLPYAYELKCRGYDVTLICKMSEDFRCKYEKDFNLVNVDIERGFCFKKTVKTFFSLVKLFKTEKFDFVEYATENISLPAAMASWFSGVPIRIYNHWGCLFVGFTGIKQFVIRMIERMIALFSTDIRQVSQKNLELCVDKQVYPAKKVKVLGYGGTIGVDFAKFELSKKGKYKKEIKNKYFVPENSMIIGFVGRIQRDKGVNELIEAFMKLYEEDSSYYLMLVGPIDTANPIKAENIKWAEECPNVILTGGVNDVYKYMSSFDLLVHPTYREGFGMVLQEAAALKIPIITTNVIGPSEFITHGFNGVLVEPQHTESLYIGIKDLISNTEQMISYAENGYNYTLENFERSVMIKRMVSDREELLKGVEIK